MWTCKICNAEIEDDTWERCWKCTTPRVLDPIEEDRVLRKHQLRVSRIQSCLNCESKLEYAGTKLFHQGARTGFWLGNLGELFVGREAYDVYFCPKCGKVELYIDGIGDALRGDDGSQRPDVG